MGEEELTHTVSYCELLERRVPVLFILILSVSLTVLTGLIEGFL